MIKKIVATILLIFILTSFTSCWNYREIENLQIVAGVAIDKGENPKLYHLTIETVDFSGGSKNAEIEPLIIESEGLTIWDAIRNSRKKMASKLYWSNCQVVIISNEIAKNGILPVIDYFFRNQEERLTLHVFISKEKSAKEILTQKSLTDPIQSFVLHDALENNPTALATTNYIKLFEVINILENNTKSLALPVVKNIKNEDSLTSELEGVAIFKEDKLLGYLNSYDTRFVHFSTDKIKGGILTQSVGSGDGHNATLEIFESKTKITPIYKNGKISMKLDINTELALTDLETDVDIMSESAHKKFLNESEQSLVGNIKRVIKKVQNEYGVDIFGFGSLISSEDPKLWDKISDNWDEIFKNLDIQITSKIVLKNSGLSKHPIKIGVKK